LDAVRISGDNMTQQQLEDHVRNQIRFVRECLADSPKTGETHLNRLAGFVNGTGIAFGLETWKLDMMIEDALNEIRVLVE